MPARTALSERRVLFFGGKGGVGKTTIASAFALRSAERGERTLLVSTDPAHSTGDVLGMSLGSKPTRVVEGLWALEIDPAREADRYIEGVKRRVAEVAAPRIMREVERQIDAARVSPGAEEAAVFERLTRVLDDEGEDYDRVVFDTAPTGHTLRLLALPEQMRTWVDGLIDRRRKLGAVRRMWRNVSGGSGESGGVDPAGGSGASGASAGSERSDGFRTSGDADDAPRGADVRAGDPDRATGGADRVAADDDPALAALERRRARFERARAVLTDEGEAAFVFVLVPERLPIEETRRAVDVLDRHGIPVGALVVNRVLPASADGDFLERRRAREAEYLERIDAVFAGRPVHRLPLFETDVHGLEMLRRLGVELPE